MSEVIELILVLLPIDEANITAIPPGTLLSAMCSEFLRVTDLEELIFYDPVNDRYLQGTDSVTDSGLENGDLIVVGAREHFDAIGGKEAGDIRQIESVEDAISEVQKFDHSSYTPQAIRVNTTTEQYAEITHLATQGLPGANCRFGGQKLVADSMRTMEVVLHGHSGKGPMFDHLKFLLRRSGFSLSRLDGCLNKRTERPNYRSRLFCNAAAVHVEPAPHNPSSLAELVMQGQVEIGEICIETVDDTRLPDVEIE